MTSNKKDSSRRDYQHLLSNQLNYSLLVTAFIYWFLTRNWNNTAYFLYVEILYIVLIVKDGALPDVCARFPGIFREKPLEWKAVCSWIIVGIGILWAVFQDNPIRIFGESISGRYERWEVAGLVGNVAFAVISPRFLPPSNKGRWSRYVVRALFVVLAIVCTKQAFAALAKGDYLHHLGFILPIAISYLIIDIVVWRQSPGRRTKYLDMALYADIPAVVALLILFWLNRENTGQIYMRIFLSGAIAFQFIVSSLILAFIEGRWPEKRPEQKAKGLAAAASTP